MYVVLSCIDALVLSGVAIMEGGCFTHHGGDVDGFGVGHSDGRVSMH